MNKKNRKFMFIAITTAIIISVIIFFYPKTNNIWDDNFTAEMSGRTQYKNMDCTCIGFVSMDSSKSRSATQVQLCFGIPINCEYSCKMKISGNWTDYSCYKMNQPW